MNVKLPLSMPHIFLKGTTTCLTCEMAFSSLTQHPGQFAIVIRKVCMLEWIGNDRKTRELEEKEGKREKVRGARYQITPTDSETFYRKRASILKVLSTPHL